MKAKDRSVKIERRGLMFVLSSPSAAGKSTIARLLLERYKDIRLSVSVTTRPRRASEVDGVHYHFLSMKRFEQMREHGELMEWAEVHGNFYGTPRDPVEEGLARGEDILFDIDVQGTLQLYETARDDVVSTFILPPSIKEMKSRLERRAEDSSDAIRLRFNSASTEMHRWRDYDYVVINDDLEMAFTHVGAILQAERLKRTRRFGLEMFVDGLVEDVLREIGK